ncbi:polyprenyl diphosphate synthase [Fluoribacter dumoffii]|uniref:Ditrans,polycis-undecaprenyl-diphosphate synthase ((2E,6E)-farnesyl-diphosphate specific) n=1 Tax=Fluoribacter dumoffii TaxID=463 RepID=A0A377GBE1_9GAMM|nr:polyprenyl diphosphate synthase [Fluoribacter dumoffii]KTC92828.1 UDP pyrophosphate synthetase [Fluoribacter dumoffii NY 23]MCW8386125.1 polyprenyl diphosphate synthase [Fluoribacter dumoffii]MCW8419176.1 polyprenyl diphosphate synthase [Fluoribacter dumoffii]MCW8452949.1 polyprenyl diphosphate synthase [Fluoribacter dumoffii]MCW8459802.1 polyprenyl diphosphate synthase [Fluoribacter dumoffii]
MKMKYPSHLAIIMDGNRRWAKNRFLPAITGYIIGAKTAWKILCTCMELNIQYLTLFSFSTENWQRTQNKQSSHLLKFIISYLSHHVERFHSKGIKIRIIGSKERLNENLLRMLDEVEKKTAQNSRLTLFIALDYGGKWDILNAAKQIVRQVTEKRLDIENLDEKDFAKFLATQEAPDPELVIRTGGEIRLSNFLLWQIAYSEIYYTPVLWPEFNEQELLKAFAAFTERQQNFGK